MIDRENWATKRNNCKETTRVGSNRKPIFTIYSLYDVPLSFCINKRDKQGQCYFSEK